VTPVPKPAPRVKKLPKPLPPRKARIKSAPADGRHSSLPPRSKPIKKSRSRRKCYRHLEHPAFTAWVRLQPCILTGKRIGGKPHRCQGIVEFSHDDNQGRGHQDFGNGFPLCTSLHTDNKELSWHRGGPKSFARRFGIDVPAVCRSYALQYLIETYGRDWEMVPEAVDLAATLPQDQETAAA
jgi:hypothetical protein